MSRTANAPGQRLNQLADAGPRNARLYGLRQAEPPKNPKTPNNRRFR